MFFLLSGNSPLTLDIKFSLIFFKNSHYFHFAFQIPNEKLDVSPRKRRWNINMQLEGANIANVYGQNIAWGQSVFENE